MVVKEVLNLTQILDLSHTSHVCMGASPAQKLIQESRLVFFSFIRSGSVLPQQKCSALVLLSEV